DDSQARLAVTIGLDHRIGAWLTPRIASQILLAALPHCASSTRERSVGSVLDPVLRRFPHRRPRMCRSYRAPSNFYLSPSAQAHLGNRLERSASDLTRAFCAEPATSRSGPRHPGRHPRCYIGGTRG